MKKRYLALALVLITTLVVAQELGDGNFRNLTLGDGTAGDRTLFFDDDSATSRRIYWDNTNDQFVIDAGNYFDMLRVRTSAIEMESQLPTLGFFDSDFSLVESVATFNASSTDGTAFSEDSEFVITYQVAGTKNTYISMTGTANANPVIEIQKTFGQPAFTIGYTGVTLSQFAFFTNAQGYYFDDDIYIDENSPGGVFLKDSGGSCFKCSLSAANAYTITNGTTDRAFDANTQCQVEFTYSTESATLPDVFLTHLRNAATWVRLSCNWNGGTTPSVTLSLEECTSAGASCTAAHTTAVTCDGGSDSTTNLDLEPTGEADDWMNLNFGTPSGVLGTLTVVLTGNEAGCELADVVGSVVTDLDTLNILGTSTDRAVSCASATCPTVSP